jgi:hypothetical protein
MGKPALFMAPHLGLGMLPAGSLSVKGSTAPGTWRYFFHGCNDDADYVLGDMDRIRSWDDIRGNTEHGLYEEPAPELNSKPRS